MYDILYNFIDHVWVTGTNSNSTEQQIYLYGAVAFALLLSVVVSDATFGIFKSIIKRR